MGYDPKVCVIIVYDRNDEMLSFPPTTLLIAKYDFGPYIALRVVMTVNNINNGG